MIIKIDLANWVPYKFNKIDVAVFDRAANNDLLLLVPNQNAPPSRQS